MVRVIEHVFAEIALPSVRARVRRVALGVALPAAIDIIGRSRRDLAAGTAEGVVVFGQSARHRRLPALEATRKQRRERKERNVQWREMAAHGCLDPYSSSLPGLTRQSIEIMA
jgi:hypothetical protein